ncbi:Ester hydrolase C11orf54, partial [Lamellibrachia satsuma]
MAMDTDIPVQKAALYYPPLEEVAGVLQDGLRENFANATVSVVDCPDLKQEPFMLAASGLCGCSRVADVGGAQNLSPTPKKDKIYDINRLAQLAGMPPGSFVFGAGAGPWHVVGVNSELVANLLTEKLNESCTVKVDLKDQSRYILEKCSCTDCSLLLNIFLSEGKGGKVLEVKAANRTGDKDIILCMRKSLSAKYGDKLLGVGGVMLLEKGKAKIHVM